MRLTGPGEQQEDLHQLQEEHPLCPHCCHSRWYAIFKIKCSCKDYMYFLGLYVLSSVWIFNQKVFFSVLFNVCRFAAEVENLKAQSCCIRIIKPLVATTGLAQIAHPSKRKFLCGITSHHPGIPDFCQTMQFSFKMAHLRNLLTRIKISNALSSVTWDGFQR